MKRLNIIDPSSTEFNRGSFCYAPYLVYNGLHITDEEDVELFESFQPEDLDNIPDAEVQLVCLWSYPQIECAMMLAMSLPFMYGRDNVYFVGYSPLIKELGLRHIQDLWGFDPMQEEFFLLKAMRNYPINYPKFNRLLLSDCDMHLKHLEKDEKVYPLFTSYGCPQGCAFCPSTKNCGKKRIELEMVDVFHMLNECISMGVKSIHFTDEDFFYNIDRAHHIFLYLQNKGMHLIALSSAKAATDYLEKYGTEVLEKAGFEVMEIGFESGDTDVSKHMGVGKSLNDCYKLATTQDLLPFSIFWLVLTFFPGETIQSLNETGVFMLEYGFEMEQVMGRLRTNGTKCGLGQFFQPYVGTAIDKTLRLNGEFLTKRPVRLIPSYLPNSFLDSEIKELYEDRLDIALPYLKLYNVPLPTKPLRIGMILDEYLEDLSTYEKTRMAISLAVLARAGVIK